MPRRLWQDTFRYRFSFIIYMFYMSYDVLHINFCFHTEHGFVFL